MQVSGTKSDLILDICQSLGASSYLSGPMGVNYLSEETFNNAGISVKYQNYIHPVYSQAWPGFFSNLSVLDLLFNHGNNSLPILSS